MKNRAASKWYGWFERYVLSGISAVGAQLTTRIKPAQDRVQTYLERLTARERQVLVILFSFLAIVFLWYLVWLPVDRWSERAHDSLVQERGIARFSGRQLWSGTGGCQAPACGGAQGCSRCGCPHWAVGGVGPGACAAGPPGRSVYMD